MLSRRGMLDFIDQFAALCLQDKCAEILEDEFFDVEDRDDLVRVFIRILSRSDMRKVGDEV